MVSAAYKVTWASVGLNLLLCVIKVTIGYLAGARSLVADGLHSLTDLSSDGAVLVGLNYAAKPADAEHPYGHHKSVPLAQLFIAAMLTAVSLLLVLQSLQILQAGDIREPGLMAAWAAAVSILAKEGLFWWTRAVAHREKNRLLLTNAWHHRNDSLSSLLVLVAVLAPALGGKQLALLDPVMGAGLGVWLAWQGLRLLREAVDELMDRAPGQAVLDDLSEHILPTPGAKAYHDLRARRLGDMLEIDLHLQVTPEATLQEAHDVARSVKQNILHRHPEVLDVLIHIEPATSEHLLARGIHDAEADLKAKQEGRGDGDTSTLESFGQGETESENR